jgi:catalase (peroxidase I)
MDIGYMLKAVETKEQLEQHYMLNTDVLYRTSPELRAIAELYAADSQVFQADLMAAWTKMMNADRFAVRPATI